MVVLAICSDVVPGKKIVDLAGSSTRKKNVWVCNFCNTAPIYMIFSLRTSDHYDFWIIEGISQKYFCFQKLEDAVRADSFFFLPFFAY